MIETVVVLVQDDLDQLVDDINRAVWDAANEMSVYDVPSLANYLKRQDTLFVACYEVHLKEKILLGFASSRFELKPYNKEKWLYVDEVDVCSDQRRKGVGTAIMRKLFELACKADCEEVWLGAELDNHAANALYKSLAPDDVAGVVGYTYELDD